ncbi:mitochondrial transcription rescue factor 1 [Daktulosphaira vitifoliae]|uniref:mitochondrial transcription rescue factor 1 n=1 Tax=Daktulosphaira vitifoliae TaxID=58002 RepID=UPI0021AA4C55|nr:mitochondrial transcription rescue factor 1 [Daktulosphaira vitifoliae]
MNRIFSLFCKYITTRSCLTSSKNGLSYLVRSSYVLGGQIKTNLAIKYDIGSTKRFKRSKKDPDENEDSDDSDLELDNCSQLIKYKTSSLRMDSVLKHALGKSRNKIEIAFFESRIRVNGKKVLKKSHSLDVGDEVDLIKGSSPSNPNFLLVSRVEILSANLDGHELLVKLRKFKNLLIDNYPDKWKALSS